MPWLVQSIFPAIFSANQMNCARSARPSLGQASYIARDRSVGQSSFDGSLSELETLVHDRHLFRRAALPTLDRSHSCLEPKRSPICINRPLHPLVVTHRTQPPQMEKRGCSIEKSAYFSQLVKVTVTRIFLSNASTRAVVLSQNLVCRTECLSPLKMGAFGPHHIFTACYGFGGAWRRLRQLRARFDNDYSSRQ